MCGIGRPLSLGLPEGSFGSAALHLPGWRLGLVLSSSSLCKHRHELAESAGWYGALAWEPTRAQPPLPPARPLALTVPQAAPECGVSSPPLVQVDAVPEQDKGATQRQDRQEGDARADAGHQAAQRALGAGWPRVSKSRTQDSRTRNSELSPHKSLPRGPSGNAAGFLGRLGFPCSSVAAPGQLGPSLISTSQHASWVPGALETQTPSCFNPSHHNSGEGKQQLV